MPTQDVTGPPYTITGLTPGANYQVRVIAENGAGSSTPSGWVQFTTATGSSPTAVTYNGTAVTYGATPVTYGG